MSSTPRLLFFADAGPQVGGGHVMRCLTLARALVDRGAECAFVESRAAAPILRRFGWPEQTLLAMVEPGDLAGLVTCGREFADRFGADLVVVDHYGAGAGEERAIAGPDRRVAVIDDLADRAHACDLLIDPGFGRRSGDYAGLLGEAHALLGPGHALVRREFAQARPRALSRRARHHPVRRVLVSFGLTDVGAITGRAVEVLAGRLGDVRLDVALSEAAPSLEALRTLAERDKRVRLHIDTANMASLVADADMGVGAGGSSVWERACLGLPTVTAVLADNQAEMVAKLAEARVALALDARAEGFEASLGAAVDRLVADRDLRWDLAVRSSDLCDGRGAERVAEAVLDLLQDR